MTLHGMHQHDGHCARCKGPTAVPLGNVMLVTLGAHVGCEFGARSPSTFRPTPQNKRMPQSKFVIDQCLTSLDRCGEIG